MKHFIVIFSTIALVYSAEVRLVDLEPSDAQQLIDQQDTSLKYAPKIDSNVPAVRFLGNEPHHVREDIYLANQYHGQDGLGGYLYGYGVPDIAKTERKQAGGDLRGAYNYIAGNGQEIKVQYWDDGTGFHQIDNVPKILPKDLPEVAAAKEQFQRLWQQEAERNSKPVASPYDSEGKYLKGLGPQPQDVPQGGQYAPHQQFPKSFNQYQGQSPFPQPHPGQNVQYFRDHQYQGQQSQNVNQYQSPAQVQPVAPNQVQPSGPSVNHEAQPSTPAEVHAQAQSQHQARAIQSPNVQSGQYNSQEGDGEDDGAYDPKKYETEEPQGPPKGFFYSFEYPVGVIVKEEGLVKRSN